MEHDSKRSGPERRDEEQARLAEADRIARRARFEESLNLLRSLGLSPNAIEHYRQVARETRQLPHELVRKIAEELAARRE